MTPEALAARHPRLYRLAMRGAADGIRRHGLLTATQIAARAGATLPATPRPRAERYDLPDGTIAWITDNSPLSAARLGPVLDDGLTPEDWLSMLNDRVFFWPEAALGYGNLKARHRLGYESEWQVYDTLALLDPAWDRAEIAPINTGATIHRPVRRGRATFARLAELDWENWRRVRCKSAPDRIKEIAVPGGLPHAAKTLIAVTRA